MISAPARDRREGVDLGLRLAPEIRERLLEVLEHPVLREHGVAGPNGIRDAGVFAQGPVGRPALGETALCARLTLCHQAVRQGVDHHREEVVVSGTHDAAVECDVAGDPGVDVRAGRPHPAERLVNRLRIGGLGPKGGERSRARFECEAELEEVRQRVLAKEPGKLKASLHDPRTPVGDRGATTLACADHALLGKDLERLANCPCADAEHLGKGTLRGQLLSRLEARRRDELGKGTGHSLGQ